MALPALQLLAREHEVVAVLTREPKPVGRKRILTPSAVQVAAEQLNIPVLTPRTLKDPQVQAQLASYQADAVAVVAYGKIVPAAALAIPRYGWFNLHFSALPRWRGAAPVQYALAAGDSTIATTVFQIDAGLDTGPIISSVTHPIPAQITAGELLDQLAQAGAAQFSRALSAIAAGSAKYTAQVGEPTFAPQLTTRDSRIDWRESAAQIERKIRAFTPEPAAWSMFGKQRVKIAPLAGVAADSAAARAAEQTGDAVASPTSARLAVKAGTAPQAERKPVTAPDRPLAPGELLIADAVWVGTGSVPVALGMVTPAGKKSMAATAWARGLRGAELRFEISAHTPVAQTAPASEKESLHE